MERVRKDKFPSLFGPEEPEAPVRLLTGHQRGGKTAAVPVIIPPDHCYVCGHPAKSHCKSGQRHGRYRFVMGARQDPRTLFTCTTRHCEEPLCSCVGLALRLQDIAWPQRPLGEPWEGSEAQQRFAEVNRVVRR